MTRRRAGRAGAPFADELMTAALRDRHPGAEVTVTRTRGTVTVDVAREDGSGMLTARMGEGPSAIRNMLTYGTVTAPGSPEPN